jgi:hypothetical protein
MLYKDENATPFTSPKYLSGTLSSHWPFSLSPLSPAGRISNRIRPKPTLGHIWDPTASPIGIPTLARSRWWPEIRQRIHHPTRTQIWPTVHSQTQIKPKTHPCGRHSLTSSSLVGSTGRASIGLVGVVVGQCLKFSAVSRFNQNEKLGYFCLIYLFFDYFYIKPT